MAAYRDLYFGGWDLSGEDLATAALRHGVIGDKELANGASGISGAAPPPSWPTRRPVRADPTRPTWPWPKA